MQTPSQYKSLAQDKFILNNLGTLNSQRCSIKDDLLITPWKGVFSDNSASSCCGVLKAGILSCQDISALWSNKENLVTHLVWQPWKGQLPYYHQHAFPYAWSNSIPFPVLGKNRCHDESHSVKVQSVIRRSRLRQKEISRTVPAPITAPLPTARDLSIVITLCGLQNPRGGSALTSVLESKMDSGKLLPPLTLSTDTTPPLLLCLLIHTFLTYKSY